MDINVILRMKNSLVSINMIVYNAEKYIKEAIESILFQKYQDFELIIIDDASTDSSIAKINQFNDKRIKIIKNSINKGIPFSRNLAIKHSKGKYIAILDADDICLPDRIVKQVQFLDQNLEYSLVGGLVRVIGSNVGRVELKNIGIHSSEEIKIKLLFKNCFSHSALMYRKEIIEQYKFNPNFSVCEDYDLIVRIASDCKIMKINDIVSLYRLHEDNISYKSSLIIKNNKKIIKKQLHNLDIYPTNEELDLHMQIIKQDRHEDFQLIFNKLNWLNKLYIANYNHNVYSKEYFILFLSGLWFNLINNPKKYNLQLFYCYYNSPIRKQSNNNLKHHIKFFLKCLLRLSKKYE